MVILLHASPPPCNYDDETSTIHITVPHFSIYCLVNKKIWMDTKTNGTFYFEAEANLTDADADGMPDCYESTNSETPETVFSLANGDTYYSLKDTTDSDGDTIADGKEILFSTVGDVNCDGTISEDDVTALQAYLGGTETLSKIALVQADCNIDGTVDEKDLELLKNYLTNAKKELADGVNLYALGMLTEGYGDLNEDGVCDVNDVVILQSFLLERETESFNNQNADLIADGILNVSVDYFNTTESIYANADGELVDLHHLAATMFDAAYPEEYADGVSIESLMNDYYGFGLNHRVDMFCVSDSISYDTVCDYTFVNGIDGIFKKEYNFSDLDRKKCANAFIRYLNTNYHQSIEEGSLD